MRHFQPINWWAIIGCPFGTKVAIGYDFPKANIAEKPKIVKHVMCFVKPSGFDSALIPDIRASPSASLNFSAFKNFSCFFKKKSSYLFHLWPNTLPAS